MQTGELLATILIHVHAHITHGHQFYFLARLESIAIQNIFGLFFRQFFLYSPTILKIIPEFTLKPRYLAELYT